MNLLLRGLILSQTIFAATLLHAVDAKNLQVNAKTLTDGVAVRQAPDDKAAAIATLNKGEEVVASDRKGTYWKVKLKDGREGFVSVTSLQTKGNAVSTAKDAFNAAKKPDPNAPKESTSQKLEKGLNGLLKK